MYVWRDISISLKMDEVISKFDSLSGPDDKTSQNNFEDLYKNWGRLGGQEERRRELLESQKDDRNRNLDKFRNIHELLTNDGDEWNWDYSNNYHKSYRPYRPTIYVAGFSYVHRYKDIIMLSEWLVDKPEDFSSNWYLVPCPKGTRVLLVASKGRTSLFSKYGHFMFQCRTELPGGNPCHTGHQRRCCIVDGYWVQKTKTFYIVDLLAWNQQPMTDGEAEFRRFWLENKLSENPILSTIKKKRNEIIFSLVPKVECDPESLNKYLLEEPPFEEKEGPGLDGFLFYHKKAKYCCGQTPLVGWLFPYMLPEVLGSDVKLHESYMAKKPIDYMGQATFIAKFEEQNAKKNEKRRSRHKQTHQNNNTCKTTPSNGNDAEANSTTENTSSDAMEVTAYAAGDSEIVVMSESSVTMEVAAVDDDDDEKARDEAETIN